MGRDRYHRIPHRDLPDRPPSPRALRLARRALRQQAPLEQRRDHRREAYQGG